MAASVTGKALGQVIVDEANQLDKAVWHRYFDELARFSLGSGHSAIGFRELGFREREPVENLPVPEKAPLVAVADAPDEQYRAVAAKLGIRSAAVLVADLEAVLADQMVPVYEYAKVAEYLQNECMKKDVEVASRAPWGRITWAWKPVRKQDRLKQELEKTSRSIYQKAIPLPVLLTIERIAEKLPEAKFFVSEIVSMPDPFLAVTVEGADKLWVIERWDEPRFRS